MSDQDAIALAERCAKAAVRVMERGRLVTIPADKENDVDIVLRDAEREIRRLSKELEANQLEAENNAEAARNYRDTRGAAVAAAYEHAARVCEGVRGDALIPSGGALDCAAAIRALIPKPTPSFDIWEGRGELPGLKPKPTPQHEHTDTCFGPNYSHCPVASATRDEERERLVGALKRWEHLASDREAKQAAAMLEADGKRIAELEADAKRADRLHQGQAEREMELVKRIEELERLLELKPPAV